MFAVRSGDIELFAAPLASTIMFVCVKIIRLNGNC
jgi:hypothetical protein